jgi:DNA primase
MITQQTIDAVRNTANLYDHVAMHTAIKRDMACCPFHNEKSPSFKIYQRTNSYKCFGCGKSGDVFTFIMEMEKKSFYEAIESLAKTYNIPVEYDKEYQQQTQQQKDLKTEALASAKWAAGRYQKALQDLPNDAPAIQYLENRGYNKERREKWDIGFAPTNNKFLTTPLINSGKHGPSVEIGLINVKEGVTKDFFYNRITIPIHDHNGIVVGLAGRQVPTDNPEMDKKYPKYLNPKESIIYSKSKIWYGLWQAQKAIKDMGYVYITEGYMDVQAMHDWGVENSIASCGTEIDINQAKFLKRYTNNVVLCYDGDDAGIKKAMKQIDMFLKLDFKVEFVELPNKQDPDEFIRTFSKGHAQATVTFKTDIHE